jgi:molybdate transport system regulatory protein
MSRSTQKNSTKADAKPVPRLRILLGASIAMGPGKADLLDAIAATGSISAAGRRMGMSYRRAWMLVETMNKSFQAPLVHAAKGGTHGGGAALTAEGVDVLKRYRAMERKAETLLAPQMKAFRKLMAPES